MSDPANRMFVDRSHVGQAIGTLKDLSDNQLEELLPTHGFPEDSIGRIRADDRAGLILERRRNLIEGELRFMQEMHVMLPGDQPAATIADSDVFDEE